ncbi:hypothetical protein CPB83DRAFT_841334 [Crepidotus variabilis]|uniref:Uncharacterized protein n=1 Tax=Crepidotus variabilis TaxID=179855 RepID=A0A9P6E2M7_9AGAR|nr:hypothetical protein CPB83DRAFT_841334 [Crepidotus variabilis]
MFDSPHFVPQQHTAKQDCWWIPPTTPWLPGPPNEFTGGAVGSANFPNLGPDFDHHAQSTCPTMQQDFETFETFEDFETNDIAVSPLQSDQSAESLYPPHLQQPSMHGTPALYNNGYYYDAYGNIFQQPPVQIQQTFPTEAAQQTGFSQPASFAQQDSFSQQTNFSQQTGFSFDQALLQTFDFLLHNQPEPSSSNDHNEQLSDSESEDDSDLDEQLSDSEDDSDLDDHPAHYATDVRNSKKHAVVW